MTDIVHPWEHRDALKQIESQNAEIEKLKKYAKYLAGRIVSQACVINSTHSPVIAATMLDDLDDAVAVSGIDPRKW